MADHFTRLRSLTLKNFRCFREEQKLDLPPTGLFLVRGSNADTSGASGSGKTSLLKGISYALGYEKLAATQLRCWTADGPMQIELGLENDFGVATVRRGSKFQFQIGDEGPKGNAALQEEGLTRYLGGLSPDVLAAVTYRAQKQPGLFLSRPDAEKKSFLSLLLGLDKLEAAADAATKKSNELLPAVDAAQGVVNVYQTSVDRLSVPLTAPESTEPLENGLREFRTNWEFYSTKLAMAKGEEGAVQSVARQQMGLVRGMIEFETAKIHAEWKAVKAGEASPAPVAQVAQLAEAKQHLAQAQDGVKRYRDEYQAAVVADNAEVRQLETVVAQLSLAATVLKPAVLVDLTTLSARLDRLQRDNLCPTCQQPWEMAARASEISRVSFEFSAKKESLVDIEAKVARLPSVQSALTAKKGTPVQPSPMLAQFESVSETIKAKVYTLTSEIASSASLRAATYKARDAGFQTRLAEVESRSGLRGLMEAENARERATALVLAGLIAEERNAQEQLQSAGRRLEVTQAKNSGLVKAESDRVRDLTHWQTQVALAQGDVVFKKVAWAEEMDFAALTKGFMGAIFDEILVEIADETNKILGKVPNTAHLTMALNSSKVTAKGASKAQITPVLMVNGVPRTMADLSGGMETAVELAVDLAVGAVVSRRTGGNVPGFLILDEPLTGLDSCSKEAVMDVLQLAGKERLILLVDHSSGLLETFDGVIEVKHLGGESSLVLAA